MVSFVGVIDIILVSILMKKICSASRNLTKRIKLHQFLKSWDQIETKKKIEDQLDIFGQKNIKRVI